jgi:hypothetical protein
MNNTKMGEGKIENKIESILPLKGRFKIALLTVSDSAQSGSY